MFHLVRAKTLSVNLTSRRRALKYLKLKRRFFSNRNSKFVKYLACLVKKPSPSPSSSYRKKSNSGVRIPFYLRKEVFVSKRVIRKLKNKFNSFKKRSPLSRKSFFYKRNKFLNRRYLSLRKRETSQLRWFVISSRRKSVRFSRGLKRRRTSHLSRTDRLNYPFSGYTKHAKSSQLLRSKILPNFSDSSKLQLRDRPIDYLNPTLSLIKLNHSSHIQTLLTFLLNPVLLSLMVIGFGFQPQLGLTQHTKILGAHSLTKALFFKIYHNNTSSNSRGILVDNNLVPSKSVNFVINKEAYNLLAVHKLTKDLVPYYYHTLVRFMEHCSGKKAAFKFYPFVHQNVRRDFFVRYRIWMARMGFYERRLGHKFFLEEALHIMHISFFMKDAKLLCSWFKAMILRISFWKTRSIFRFIKYLMLGYFYLLFPSLNIKGLKIKLKGKISAAGNSRKRRILYRVGETSHSQASLRVLYEFVTINTFTGVMGFQLWIFY